ncbi:MAG: DUF29 domain-containing protein [Candidatus Contendobacter sp.]|nr:DUF29 domain-containing protein [Candidatus Contendobacter sp.]
MTAATPYETDFYQWTQQQAALLRQGHFSELYTVHLIDEIEDMGASNRRALGSYLELIMLHLLKWRYQPERRCNSWGESIGKGRNAVERLLEESPSLTPRLSTMVTAEYRRAKKEASLETRLSLATFPEQCPFTVEQITGDYWPD